MLRITEKFVMNYGEFHKNYGKAERQYGKKPVYGQ